MINALMQWMRAAPVPEQLLYQLNQWEALFVGRLVDASVDQVFVQGGATAMQRGSARLLLINLLLFLGLLLCFNVLV